MNLDPYPTAIPYGRQCIEETDIEAVVSTLKSDYVTQGPAVAAFEAALCEVTGARYAIAVASGTAALHLACRGLGIKRGDRGVVPAITFAATANCLRYCDATVDFCDVDRVSGLATPSSFRDAIGGEGAKVLLPVSYSGAVCDMEGIAEVARDEGAFVIEDAAHSIGAAYRDSEGNRVASGSCMHSDAAILSFHPVKHICAGEGGAVLTNDATLARRVRRLRSHGIEKLDAWKYDQVELGFHYRMTDLQASLGRSQLSRLDANICKRREIAKRYSRAFSEEPFRSRIRISNTDEESSWHLFVVHFQSAEVRQAAYDFLHEHNVRAQVHYMPVYRHSYYKEMGCCELSGAEAFYESCLSLPMYPSLKDVEQEYVIRCLRHFLGDE